MPDRIFRPTTKIVLTTALSLISLELIGPAHAQVVEFASYPPMSQAARPSGDGVAPEETMARVGGANNALPGRLRRAVVALETREAPGTIIIETGNTALYYVLDHGHAIRYGVGVGRDGFTWSGVQAITRKSEWPDWHPPARMIARQPYLPRFMAGGPGNPLGARAIYLGSSEYRIHGTNDPATIGKFVSSGCIRLTNEDIIDLFNRVSIGTKVVVLPKNATPFVSRALASDEVSGLRTRSAVTMLPSGRQAMNLSILQPY